MGSYIEGGTLPPSIYKPVETEGWVMVKLLYDMLTKLFQYPVSCPTTILLLLLTVAPPAVTAASTNTLTVSATVISKSKCKFNSATATLNFGALDPGNPVDIAQDTTVTFVCNGSAPIAAFAITTDDGLYETGPGANRMRHATVLTEYLKYALALSPANSTVPKATNSILTITGTVAGADYQSAQIGNYADTVILSITP